MENLYESARLLDEYLLFHYGSIDEVLPVSGISYPAAMRDAWGFPRRTVMGFTQKPVARGLDLGCAVGAATFAMARHCREVIGIDFSHSFIAAAEKLRRGEKIPYRRTDEGHLLTSLCAEAPQDIARSRISFEQGDAHALRHDIGTFDQVHAANLLCRLAQPKLFLERLPNLLRPAGELVIATPCTWLENFTPPANWPTDSTIDWIKSHLSETFDLVNTWDVPFLIRETARKFQWTSSQLSLWRRHA